MNWGALQDYFAGVAWKRLTAHEVDAAVSNGHEFQGVAKLRELLGAEPLLNLPATYLLFGDDDGPPDRVRSTVSWYDARANDPKRSAEWRLYYPGDAGAIQVTMQAGDLMVIALLKSSQLAILLAPQGSEREAQLTALLGLDLSGGADVQVRHFPPQDQLSFTAASILEDLGLANPQPQSGGEIGAAMTIAQELAATWGRRLPTGRTVAALIQERISGGDAVADPDSALHLWIEAQAAVYRLWEDEVIRLRIKRGFFTANGEPDVNEFREFTMSLRQSRVSRAGGALQLHVARILRENSIRFEEQVVTENNERPDFILPGAAEYHDSEFAQERLRMLAVKFTLKDRWRQVLNEAARIPHKHLLTMDAAVTASSLRAMTASSLTIVIPAPIRNTYPRAQQGEIVSVRDFVDSMAGELSVAASR